MNTIIAKLLKCFYFAAIVSVVFLGYVIIQPRYSKMKGLNEEKARILQRIEDKKAEIAALRDKQRRFNTDKDFVEALARQNRRLFPGELVFVFDD